MATLNFTEGQEHPPLPIQNSNQLIPNLIDGVARSRPDALYARIPNSYTSYASGYRDVTYRQLANAVNGVAWLLSQELGKSKKSETLAYFGPNDIGYVIVIVGAVKAGYTILSPSPRLVHAHYIHVLKECQCSTILTLDKPYGPAVQALIEDQDYQARVVHVPTIYQLLDTEHRHFPYPFTFDAIKNEPLVKVHSSGTTGAPKPLVYTHAAGSSFINEMRDPPPDGHYNAISLVQSNTIFTAFPFFHSGGLLLSLLWAIANQTTMIAPLAGVIPSGDVIVEGMKLVHADTLLIPTPFLEQIARKQPLFDEAVARVRSIAYSGADLSESVGDAFSAAGVCVSNFFASSESMMHPTTHALHGAPVDAWHYIQPHPYINARFDPQADDLFELVWVRNTEPARVQPIFVIYPHLTEFRTRDLFSRHPLDTKLWRFRGRADDLITSATGEMCNPIAFEQDVSALPGVAAALVIGTGRWQKALLIEPADQVTAAADFVAGIWPKIEMANEKLTRISRIKRSHVLLTSPDLPMLRAGKGSVQRAPTLKLYEAQIAELYRLNGDETDPDQGPVPVHIAIPDDQSVMAAR